MSLLKRLLVKLALSCAIVPSAGWGADAGPPILITYNPLVLPGVGQQRPLALRISFPKSGNHLPIVLFSHGHGYSKDDYLPLAEYWAVHGFVVIQPTHPDAAVGGIADSDPRQADVWRLRIDDLHRIIDGLPQIEADIPALRGRMDFGRIVAAGHSFGGHTVAALIGAKVKDPKTGSYLDLSDKRVKGAVILAAPGAGGADLSPQWVKPAAFLDVDWSTMRAPALVVAGTLDTSPMTVRGPEWHQDPYWRSPAGGKCLIVLNGSRHYMGGVLGVHRTEVDDENPARLAAVQSATLAYLQLIADGQNAAWAHTRAALSGNKALVQSLDCK